VIADQVELASRSLAVGDVMPAVAGFRQLLRLAQSCNDFELAEVASHHLAIAHRLLRDPTTAAFWQQQSITWHQRRTIDGDGSNDSELERLACDLTGRGADELAQGQLATAESLWRRALAIEEWRGCLEGQAIDCGNLGLLAAMRGDFVAGIRWLRKSKRLHERMFDLVGLGTDWLNLAELFRLLGRFQTSQRCARRAVKSFERAGANEFVELARSRLDEANRTISVLTFNAELN
jgi:tetratricopeptide (TPR) repeat protein